MERNPADDGFSHIERKVMALLAQDRTRDNVSELLSVLHPLLDYYIRFFMYRFGIYDSHSDRGDIYGEMYLKCVGLLGDIRLDGIVPRGDYDGQLTSSRARSGEEERGTANFARVKRYLNKSIAGWIYNRVYKKKKRDVELTHDDMAAMVFPDPEDRYGEVETAADIEAIEGHLKNQTPLYVELCSALFGSGDGRSAAALRFRSSVYSNYSRSGALPLADDAFRARFGGMFD